MLSDYFAGIKGTKSDTEVYVFDSGIPGGTALLGGGTHANEAAAFLAPVVILENLKVTCGRVFIIPRLNNSAFTCTDPMEGFPDFYSIKTKAGLRTFRLGSRVTNPLDQWPDRGPSRDRARVAVFALRTGAVRNVRRGHDCVV